MRSTQVGLIMCSGALLLGACASGRGGGSDDAGADNGVAMVDGAVILRGEALTERSGTILAAMTGKVPNFRVIRNSRYDCPQISLRQSHTDYQGRIINPQVYVDGTRATDTCILESVRSGDVERIEVYPQGFTTRPGYARHASGLILVFMRSG